VLSISDELMWTYYELLTDLTVDAVARLRADVAAGAVHPKQTKVDLAKRIVADFHSAEAAEQAAAEFERVHVQRQAPEAVPELTVSTADTLSRILVQAKLASSGAEATRKIKQGAVRIDGARVAEFAWRAPGPGSYLMQVGPRAFVRLVVAE
jgi:tyrosyl-tRNA synthetase